MKKPKPRKVGRPSIYTPAVAEAVCVFIVDGKSLRQIGEEPGMPAKATIVNWLAKHEDFRVQYVRAREAQALLGEDEILEIADDSARDFTLRKVNGVERVVFDREHVERSRLRVDTRKWLMAKRLPKRYGEKLDVNHAGEIGITERMEAARKRLKAERDGNK